jgi:hypothetical protein
MSNSYTQEYQRRARRDGALAASAWASEPRIAAELARENPPPPAPPPLPPIDNRRTERAAIERIARTECEKEETLAYANLEREANETSAGRKDLEGTMKAAQDQHRAQEQLTTSWNAKRETIRTRHAAALDAKLTAAKLDDASLGVPLGPPPARITAVDANGRMLATFEPPPPPPPLAAGPAAPPARTT